MGSEQATGLVIQATEKLLRCIAEKRTVDRVRNVEIRDELKQEGVLEKVKRSQVRWRKALEGMGPERIVKRLYEAETDRRRGQGEPRKNGMIILNNDMFMLQIYVQYT